MWSLITDNFNKQFQNHRENFKSDNQYNHYGFTMPLHYKEFIH